MSDAEREILKQLVYRFGTQSLILGAVMGVLNAEIPEFKAKLITLIESQRHPNLTGQAMIDEALDYVKSLR